MLFDNYTSTLCLKQTTLKDYQTVIPHYLSDWMNKKVTTISKRMVERRFTTIRDKGWKGGIPTHSQANKTMRILSALMNYAMADDIVLLKLPNRKIWVIWSSTQITYNIFRQLKQ